jgi:hypothetical protein
MEKEKEENDLRGVYVNSKNQLPYHIYVGFTRDSNKPLSEPIYINSDTIDENGKIVDCFGFEIPLEKVVELHEFLGEVLEGVKQRI